MRRFLLILCVLLMLPAGASAKDMNGKFGIGLSQTLGGVSGATFRYWATRSFGIEAIIGVSLIDRGGLRSSTTLNSSLGVLYAFVQKRTANLSIGARLDFGFRTAPAAEAKSVRVSDAVDSQTASSTQEASDTTFQFNVEVPLIVEYFFSDSFSVTLAFGFVVVIVPDEGKVLETSGHGSASEPGELGFGAGTGGLFGSAGFTFYF